MANEEVLKIIKQRRDWAAQIEESGRTDQEQLEMAKELRQDADRIEAALAAGERIYIAR
jgi:hypothetical protein